MEDIFFKKEISNTSIGGIIDFYNLRYVSHLIDIDTRAKPKFELIYKLKSNFTTEGLISIEVNYLSVKGNINLYIDTEDLKKELIKEIETLVGQKNNYNTNTIDWIFSLETNDKWMFKNEVNFQKNGEFFPEYLDIDVNLKKITVE